MGINDSNVFGNFDKGEDLIGLDDSNSSLAFRAYSVLCVLKQGEYLDAFLDKEKEIESDLEKIFNLCCWSNLGMITISSLSNMLDLALTLSEDGSNLKHLEVLRSINFSLFNKVRSLLRDASSDLNPSVSTYRTPRSEEYNELVDQMSSFKLFSKVEESLKNLVIGGSCYSKLISFSRTLSYYKQVSFDMCKDLRFCSVNKHSADVNGYSECVKDLLNHIASLIKDFYNYVSALCSLINENSCELFDNREIISLSKALVDNYRLYDESVSYGKFLEKRLFISREKSLINSRRIVLIKKDFKVIVD